MEFLRALNAGDVARAEQIRGTFLPLETLRNQHGPIPVLHDAVAQCGVADTGPILPLLAPPSEAVRAQIGPVAKTLLAAN
jgi:dihydrodipicolinate synthase/N-acetylneuraminate lyase